MALPLQLPTVVLLTTAAELTILEQACWPARRYIHRRLRFPHVVEFFQRLCRALAMRNSPSQPERCVMQFVRTVFALAASHNNCRSCCKDSGRRMAQSPATRRGQTQRYGMRREADLFQDLGALCRHYRGSWPRAFPAPGSCCAYIMKPGAFFGSLST